MSGVDFLLDIASSSEEKTAFQDLHNNLVDLHEKKLWHQVTVQLLDLVQQDSFAPHLLTLYNNFIKSFQEKINPLDLVVYAVAASKNLGSADEQAAFIKSISEVDSVKNDAEAALLVKLEDIYINIRSENFEDIRSRLDEARSDMGKYPGIMDRRVHSHLYLVAVGYHKDKGSASEFYENALSYLAYTPLESIPKSEQVGIASAVGLAALVGANVYNFGELLQHPVVNALEGTEFGWLSKLLAAFNSGDIAGYQAIAANKPAEVLVKNAALLNQKIRIMALMDMVFSRSSDDRIIDFGEIAEQCQLDANEVELLLMKAFSLKVLKGKIDQVNSNVLFTWVQPRVLNQTQIAGLADRLAAWSDKVNETALLIEGNASEILTSGGF